MLIPTLAVAAMGFALAAPVPAAPKDAPAVDAKLVEELLLRLNYLNNMPGPQPGITSPDYVPLVRVTRKWLADEDAQNALLHKLPGMTTPQLVRLWDVLWIPTNPTTKKPPKDLNEIAPGFAGRFNETVLAALAREKEAKRRQLFVNMIKPQAHTLTEKQAVAFAKLQEDKGQ